MKDIITYFGKRVKVACDEKCNKAWGVNSRPRIAVIGDDDMLDDQELGTAPIDPGTYEGGQGKPLHISHAPNNWCVRECERCVMGGVDEVLTLPIF